MNKKLLNTIINVWCSFWAVFVICSIGTLDDPTYPIMDYVRNISVLALPPFLAMCYLRVEELN